MNTLQSLREELEALGFRIAPNDLAGPENDCRWYAYKRLPVGARDCELNDKPPSLIVTPYLGTIHGKQYTSTEVSVTGQAGEWFKLMAYSVASDKLIDALPQIEAALVRAWNALGALAALEAK